MFLLLLSCLATGTTIAANIKPTTSTAEVDSYVASESNTSFVDGKISCDSAKECVVECDVESGCQGLSIYCPSDSCSLHCSNRRACYEATFVVDYVEQEHAARENVTMSSTLSCTAEFACLKLTANVKTTPVHAEDSSFDAVFYGTQAFVNASLEIDGVFVAHILYGENAGVAEGCAGCIGNNFTFENMELVNMKRDVDAISGFTVGDSFLFSNISHEANVTCQGYQSCSGADFESNIATRLVIDCLGDKACSPISVNQSRNASLYLFCVQGDDICAGSDLFVSPLSDHTTILCNGTRDSGSCNDLAFTTPPDPQERFIRGSYPNAYGDGLPYPGSLDNITFKCEGVELCSDFTVGPIVLGPADPSKVENDTKLLFNGTYAYQYQYRSVTCLNDEFCDVRCLNHRTCSNALVECRKGSACRIECASTSSCDGLTVVAYGQNVEIECLTEETCAGMRVWIPDPYTGVALDMSSCQDNNACPGTEFLCGDRDHFIENGLIETEQEILGCQEDGCCPEFADNSPGPKGKPKTGLIVGIVCGIVVLLALLGGFWYYRQRNLKSQTGSERYENLIND